MTSSLRSPIGPMVRYLLNLGAIAPGCKIFVYEAGSMLPTLTWRDARLTLSNTSPIIVSPDPAVEAIEVWALPATRLKVLFADAGNPSVAGRVIDNLPMLDDVQSNGSGRTAAEMAAGIVPTDVTYPELNILRYGAVPNAGDAAHAIRSAVLVAVAHGNGEVLVPPEHIFNLTQLVLDKVSGFRIRCDGILKSMAKQSGEPYTDQRSTYQGRFSPLKLIGCEKFKIYGNGQLENGYVESMYLVACKNFDISLDLRGNGKNSTLPGLWVQSCSQFVLHDMTWESLTAQRMNDATEVYHPWLNHAQIQQSDNFRVTKLISRRSGMNGIYVGSDCKDFEISDSIFEYGAGSGMQMAYQGFGSAPMRYQILRNTVRYNQADGIDANNTSGGTVPIFAQFRDNKLSYNGWKNCKPANGGGSDGSGIGTYIYVSDFEANGNIAYECASWGAYVNKCENYNIIGNKIIKLNHSSLNGGVYVSDSNNGAFEANDIVVAETKQALLMTPCQNVVFVHNSFSGLVTLNNGSYPECKLLACIINCCSHVEVPFDMSDCNLTVSSTDENGIYITNDGVTLSGNSVIATNHAIVVSSVNHCKIIDNVAKSTGRGNAILVTGSKATILRGNIANAMSGNGIFVTGGSSRTELSNNKAGSQSGNSFRIDQTTTHTFRNGNVTLSGIESFEGSYDRAG